MARQKTRRLERQGAPERDFERFVQRFEASLVVLSGREAGNEIILDQPVMSIGRGPGVDLALPDETLSQSHACLEFADGGYRLRDLGSTNGSVVNDAPVEVADLKSGDRIQLGQQLLQLVVEPRRGEPPVHVLPAD